MEAERLAAIGSAMRGPCDGGLTIDRQTDGMVQGRGILELTSGTPARRGCRSPSRLLHVDNDRSRRYSVGDDL
jgi:hypothetical protein